MVDNFLSIKGQMVDIFDFANQVVSVGTTKLCHFSMETSMGGAVFKTDYKICGRLCKMKIRSPW
jgi:hypothetical protein